MKKAGLLPTLAFSAMALVGCSDNDEPTENIEKKSQPDQELIEPQQKCESTDDKDQECDTPKKERKPGLRDRYRSGDVSQIADVSPSDYEIG